MFKKLFKPTLFLLTLISAAAIFPAFPNSIPKVVFASLFLTLVPGYLLLVLLMPRRWKASGLEILGYSVGLSIIFSMLFGLALNSLLPLVGITHPLNAGILALAFFESSLLMLVGCQLTNRRLFSNISAAHYQLHDLLLIGCAVGLPILASGGALSLNNGGPNLLGLGALAGIASLFLIAIWRKKEFSSQTYGFLIFTMSLSLLLAISLRGNYITGHDIIQEYQVFQLTASHNFWSMSYLHDAYNACLSITILPTILQKVSGLSDAYIFKLIYQFIFALMPVMLYFLMARFTTKRIAFLAAFIFLSFPTFMTDMPMLGRQELAFLSFVLFFSILFDIKLAGLRKNILLITFGCGIIFSHYSTSYVALGVIVLAKLLESSALVWRAIRRQPRHEKSRWMPLGWISIVCLLSILFAWNVLITKTSGGISRTISNITLSLPKVGSLAIKSGASTYSVIGKKTSAEEQFKNYVQTAPNRREFTPASYYDQQIIDQYPTAMKYAYTQPVTRLGQKSQLTAGQFQDVYESIRSDYALIIQILIVFGMIMILVYPRVAKLPSQYQYFGLASLFMIGLQVALPSSVIDYGLLRLIQQSLVFLALPIILGCLTILSWLRVPDAYRTRAIALFSALFFIVLSGLAPALTGGYKPTLATSNSGFYYEAYYTHKDELAGYGWLTENAPKGAIVYADEFARRKMITYSGIYARSGLIPANIARDSYVYLSHGDLAFGDVPVYYNGDLFFATPPTQFLSDQKDLVYSSGLVKIYK